jgi:hypothetical protein
VARPIDDVESRVGDSDPLKAIVSERDVDFEIHVRRTEQE